MELAIATIAIPVLTTIVTGIVSVWSINNHNTFDLAKDRSLVLEKLNVVINEIQELDPEYTDYEYQKNEIIEGSLKKKCLKSIFFIFYYNKLNV